MINSPFSVQLKFVIVASWDSQGEEYCYRQVEYALCKRSIRSIFEKAIALLLPKYMR